MLIPNARGYLLAVTLFLVCCWLNPNDAIPYRAHPHAEEQVIQRVDNGADLSEVNVTHRDFGHRISRADKKPALSGGGEKSRSSQHPRSPANRIRNVNINVNVNHMGKIHKSVTRPPKMNYATEKTSRLPKTDQSTEFSELLPIMDYSTESTSPNKSTTIYYSTESISQSPKINDSAELTSSTTLPEVVHFTEHTSPAISLENNNSIESISPTQSATMNYPTEATGESLKIDFFTSQRPNTDRATEITSLTALPEVNFPGGLTNPTELSEIDYSTESFTDLLPVTPEIGHSDYTLLDFDQSTDTIGSPILSEIANTTGSISKCSNVGHSTDDLNKTQQFPASIYAGTDDHDISEISMESLITETLNCSESHNKNNRYSSSFNGNLTVGSSNVSDDSKVADESETKRTSSVHVDEDITLCWIETTTIKEDRSSHPIQRLVIREYTISFENSATIPQRYLECVQLEGEVDGKNNSFPRSALFEVIDENTQHSRIVNFTTISRTDNLIVWQHRRVRCGVGPVVTKNIIDLADDDSSYPKKRVEIKVSPKIHKLYVQPIEIKPCITDFADPQLTSTTPATTSSSEDCGSGTTCDDYSDCLDEWCEDSTILNGDSTLLMDEKQTTELFVTTFANEKGMSQPITATEEYATTELLSTSTEFSSDSNVTLSNEPHTHEEMSDYKTMIPGISEELDFDVTEIGKSCESGDYCADFPFESTTSSEKGFSDYEITIKDVVTQVNGKSNSPEEFTIRPTIDTSFDQIVELKTDGDIEYLSSTERDTTTETTEFVEITTTEPLERVTPKIEINTTEASTTGATNIWAYVMNETLTTVVTTDMSTREDITTTQELPSTSCESRENCVFNFENENLKDVHIPEGLLVKECDDGNETLSCKSVSISSESTIEIMAMETGDRLEKTTDGPATSSGEMITEEVTNGGTTEAMVSTATLRAETTVQKSTTGFGMGNTETTMPLTTSSGETATEGDTDSSVGVTEIRASLTTFGGESTTQETTNVMSDEVDDMSTSSTTTTLGEKTTTGDTTTAIRETRTVSTTIGSETITGMSEAMTEKPTTIAIGELTATSTTIGIETTTGVTETTTEVNERERSEIAVFSNEETIPTSTKVYPRESTTEISNATHETTFHTTDFSVKETTATVLRVSIEEFDFRTTTDTIAEFTPDDETGTAYATTDVNEEMSTRHEDRSTNATTTEFSNQVTASSNQETTTIYSVTSSMQMETTTKVPSCDFSTGECDTTQTLAVTPVTLSSCDPERESCDSRSRNTTSSCDGNSNNCSIESSSIPYPILCDVESDECFFGSATVSTTNCDDESGDCISGGLLSKSTTACDENSSSSCITIGGIERYSSSTDSSELCDDGLTGNCTEEIKPQDPAELLPTTTSSTNEVDSVSTTVSDVTTTAESRVGTTMTAILRDPKLQHKVALEIKILLEHIDDNNTKQKLVEVEKHLLFNENSEEHDQDWFMEQVRALNNTVDMQTVEALFNASIVEKLTGDVGAFTAKYLPTHDGIRNVDGHDNSVNSSEDLNQDSSEKSDIDPNVEMSLPGIHDDIHSGLTHLMTPIPSGHKLQKRSARASEEEIPRSRILEVVLDPRDKRIHTRRKKRTIEDLATDNLELLKDMKKAGHWSNERVKRAINGGHIRTLTEFTIYKSP